MSSLLRRNLLRQALDVPAPAAISSASGEATNRFRDDVRGVIFYLEHYIHLWGNMIFAVLAVKFMTTRLLVRMRRQIGQVGQLKQDVLNRLKSVQNQKTVTAKNTVVLQRKKDKLGKELSERKEGLSEITDEEESRRQRTKVRKVT